MNYEIDTLYNIYFVNSKASFHYHFYDSQLKRNEGAFEETDIKCLSFPPSVTEIVAKIKKIQKTMSFRNLGNIWKIFILVHF